jgi:hypothetical protein
MLCCQRVSYETLPGKCGIDWGGPCSAEADIHIVPWQPPLHRRGSCSCSPPLSCRGVHLYLAPLHCRSTGPVKVTCEAHEKIQEHCPAELTMKRCHCIAEALSLSTLHVKPNAPIQEHCPAELIMSTFRMIAKAYDDVHVLANSYYSMTHTYVALCVSCCCFAYVCVTLHDDGN